MNETIMLPPAHPRVIRIPAPETLEPLAPARRRKPLAVISGFLFNGYSARLVSFLAVLVLLLAAADQIWTQAGYTVRQFDMRPSVLGMTDAERMSRGKMGLAGAALAYSEAYAADPHGLAFGFSQAEMSYYGRAPFISYFDDAAVPLLNIADPEELWRALRARDVRYVLQPAYPLAELSNSAFDPLLADPRLTEIAFEKAGTRLLRVLPAPEEIQPRVLAEEGFAGKPLLSSQWTVFSPGKPGETAQTSISPAPDGVSVKIPQRLFADRQRSDFLQRGLPVNNKPGAFLAPPGRLRISAEITGKGRVDLVARNLTPNRATTADTLVWSGVLTGKRRIIAAQIITPVQAADDATGRRPMGLDFRAYHAGDFIVHNWRAEWLPPAGQTIEAAALAAVASPTPSAPTAAAPTPAALQAEPPVSVAYVLRQPANLEPAAVETLLAAKQVEARLVVNAANAPETGMAYCADGRAFGLSLKAQRDKGIAETPLPCWPRAVTLVWPSPRERGSARVVVRMEGAPERVVPLAALSDILAGAPPSGRPARTAP
jgi:hypothetical protein